MKSNSDTSQHDFVNIKMKWATDKDLLDYIGYSDTDIRILRIFEESKCNSLKKNMTYSKCWQKYLLQFNLNEDEINGMLLDPNVVKKLQAVETITHVVNIIRQCKLNYIDPRDGKWVQMGLKLAQSEVNLHLV
jgi:hypothetical protein